MTTAKRTTMTTPPERLKVIIVQLKLHSRSVGRARQPRQPLAAVAPGGMCEGAKEAVPLIIYSPQLTYPRQ